MLNLKLPQHIIEQRKNICLQCNCPTNKEDPCAICPQKKWFQSLCFNFVGDIDLPPQNIDPVQQDLPSIKSMGASFVDSIFNWGKNGFAKTDEKTLKNRIETCQGCEFWNPQGFNGTGRCMKCGCSTWAKLRMATEKCPIGKW
jgi:hypothetical protein